MTVLKPEFLLPNFIAPQFNENAVVTLSPTANWYQANKKYLYDNFAGEQINLYNRALLYTENADDDTTDVEIKVDLGDIERIGVIRLCNINGKAVKVEYSEDDVTYTTLLEETNNLENYLAWYALDDVPYADFGYYLTTDKGEYIVTSSGEKIEVNVSKYARYIKVTIGATQVADSEKYIGELYIGDLYCRPMHTSLMSDTFTDSNASDLTMYNNKSNRRVNRATLSQKLSFHAPNKQEFTFIKNLINYGYMFNYVPNPNNLEDLTHNFEGKDIYLCQVRNEAFNYQSFGRNASGTLNISIKEAAVVTRQF